MKEFQLQKNQIKIGYLYFDVLNISFVYTSYSYVNYFLKINDQIEPNVHCLTNRTKLESLAKALVQNRNLVEESIDEIANRPVPNSVGFEHLNQYDKLINWLINFKEKMKTFQTLVFNVSYELLDSMVNALDILEKKLVAFKNRKMMNERQPLIMSTINKDNLDFKHYNYKIDSSGSKETAESYETSTLYPPMFDLVNNSLHAILMFVNCAAVSFNWSFKLKPIYSNKALNDNEEEREKQNFKCVDDAIDIIQSEDKFSLHFHGLSRLNALYNSLIPVLGLVLSKKIQNSFWIILIIEIFYF